MNIFYTIAIRIYQLSIYIASLKNEKARDWIRGRKNWVAKLKTQTNGDLDWIWFHCSSLGEYEDCCEIFLSVQKLYPTTKTILTVFSPSAFHILTQNKLYDIVTYMPIDIPSNASKFLDIIQPKFILFSRSELWYHFLTQIHKRKIPLFLLSLRLQKDSNFLRYPFRVLYGRCFKTFTHIFCQDLESQTLLQLYFKICNSSIIGNTRIERILESFQKAISFEEIEAFVMNHFVIVVGSSLPKDEKFILEAINELKSFNIKWLVVPHELENSLMKNDLIQNPNSILTYSNIKSIQTSHQILVIDKVGILKHLYQFANLSIIGGGFNRIGIHNILEPAVYGNPILFGPNHRNYTEAKDLMRLGAAQIFRNKEELCNLIREIFSQGKNSHLTEKINTYIREKKSNSKEIAQKIQDLVTSNSFNTK